MMEQGYMVLGTPKNIITLDADNSVIQLTTFEFSYVFTFSRKSPMSCTSVIYFACIDYSNAKLFYSMLRRIWTSPRVQSRTTFWWVRRKAKVEKYFTAEYSTICSMRDYAQIATTPTHPFQIIKNMAAC